MRRAVRVLFFYVYFTRSPTTGPTSYAALSIKTTLGSYSRTRNETWLCVKIEQVDFNGGATIGIVGDPALYIWTLSLTI